MLWSSNKTKTYFFVATNQVPWLKNKSLFSLIFFLFRMCLYCQQVTNSFSSSYQVIFCMLYSRCYFKRLMINCKHHIKIFLQLSICSKGALYQLYLLQEYFFLLLSTQHHTDLCPCKVFCASILPVRLKFD